MPRSHQQCRAASGLYELLVRIVAIALKGLTASSYAFDNAAHALTLFNGDAVLDTIRFSQGTTSGSFHMGQFASINVVQTGGGVYLRGSYNFTQGAEIPLHVGAPAAA